MPPIERIGGLDMIPLRDVVLWQDVQCCACGRLMALTNALRISGHYICPNCRGKYHA